MVKITLKVMSDKNATFRSDDDRGDSMAVTCFYNNSATASPPVFPSITPTGGFSDGQGFI